MQQHHCTTGAEGKRPTYYTPTHTNTQRTWVRSVSLRRLLPTPPPTSPSNPSYPTIDRRHHHQQTMAKDMPSRHAGLVTFNAEVSLIGDGSGDSRVVAGDRLSDAEALKDVGRAYPLSRPVSEARTRLSDRLFALEEGGPTALGPAVVAGLSMIKVP